jgi:dihydroorotate dehydrogenase electron transfer subunit
MPILEARLTTVRMEEAGGVYLALDCPSEARPAPGQYLLAVAQGEGSPSPLGQALFPGGWPGLHRSDPHAVLTFSAEQPGWLPGTRLSLRGPLGTGFQLPAGTRRLALAALGPGTPRLLPLATQALESGLEVALFSSARLPPGLPAELEIFPLSSVPQALMWADHMALDLALSDLPVLRRTLGLGPAERFRGTAQVLVETPMPCGGMADCGVCAVPGRKGWRMACLEGPVFDLEQVEW